MERAFINSLSQEEVDAVLYLECNHLKSVFPASSLLHSIAAICIEARWLSIPVAQRSYDTLEITMKFFFLFFSSRAKETIFSLSRFNYFHWISFRVLHNGMFCMGMPFWAINILVFCLYQMEKMEIYSLDTEL